MANVIPQQIVIRNGQLHTEFVDDNKASPVYISQSTYRIEYIRRR